MPTNPGNAKDLDVLGASGAVNYALREVDDIEPGGMVRAVAGYEGTLQHLQVLK
eukprot:COSAG04_NODE_618_length_11896_cov_81.925659_18_plen_54_part_00